MPKSVLEAVKLGFWDFEPAEVDSEAFASTEAMPGTRAKLEVLANRVRSGLPLWHPRDRDDIESPPLSINRPR